MKGALLAVVATIAILGAVIGVSAWSPWGSDQHERESAWVEAMLAWSDVDAWAGRRTAAEIRSCEARYDDKVGSPPSSRLEPVSRVARRGCRETVGFLWDEVADRLVMSHFREADTIVEADLSRIAGEVAGTRVRVNCWQEQDWGPFAEQYGLFNGDEFRLAGYATPSRGRIDLAPSVCDYLRRFFRSQYAPRLNLESLDLADALVTLAHEAEHLRTPSALEDVVECHALQRVRGIVRDAGRGRWYQREMAGLAWDVGYPHQAEDYRTEFCFDGGPLDLDRRSKTWP